MSTRSRPCPSCGIQLEQGRRKDLSTWECPKGDGVGVFLIDAWGTLQRDELESLWANTKTAPQSSMLSPVSGEPMLEVTFPVDPDSRAAPGGASEMTIEVDTGNYFGWFELHEIEAMPVESENRGATEPGMVGLDQMDMSTEQNRDVFINLTPEDLEGEPRTPAAFLSGLADRLRVR